MLTGVCTSTHRHIYVVMYICTQAHTHHDSPNFLQILQARIGLGSNHMLASFDAASLTVV